MKVATAALRPYSRGRDGRRLLVTYPIPKGGPFSCTRARSLAYLRRNEQLRPFPPRQTRELFCCVRLSAGDLSTFRGSDGRGPAGRRPPSHKGEMHAGRTRSARIYAET